MDKPFSAFDPPIRKLLRDVLIQLQNDLKKTIIFVSHDLKEALKLGNLILPLPVIDKIGKLIGVIGTEEIFSTILSDMD